ncbi:MAG: hypothetical protein ACJ77N_02480 [Chloroflexota bacterium]
MVAPPVRGRGRRPGRGGTARVVAAARWWATKARQFGGHLVARVRPGERAQLRPWLTPAELAIFDAMHVADRRHGLDVVRRLRQAGVTERDVLAAGLLHDCGKADTGVLPRVVWSLGQGVGRWVPSTAAHLRGLAAPLDRLARHADLSADLLAAAGCPERMVDLVRYQDAPRDPRYGALLKDADEAS